MKTQSMTARVEAYLQYRRSLGYALRTEGELLLNFGRYADQFNPGGRLMQLMGKGRKQRLVPIWQETRHLIRSWERFAKLKSDQPLMPNRFGGQMTRTAVQQRLQLMVKAAQRTHPSLLHKHISPHTIRHTTAMHLLQSGVATPVISLWLGHEDPVTTHQYIEADLVMKENALGHLQPPRQRHVRFHPQPDLLKFLDNLRL